MNDENPRYEALRKTGLPDRLKQLRVQAQLTGKALAERIGQGQPTVSKYETGNRTPTPELLAAWAAACGHPEVTDELRELLNSAELLWTSWQDHLREGAAAAQQSVTDLIDQSERIVSFEVANISGPLQTPNYTRALLDVFKVAADEADLDAAVAVRMERWRALYDPTKRWELLMTEAVLHLWPDAGPDTPTMMRSQIDRIASAIGLPNVRLGFVPFNTPLRAWPQNSFAVYDDLVIVELSSGEAKHFVGPDVVIYRQLLADLWNVAVDDEPGIQAILERARTTTR